MGRGQAYINKTTQNNPAPPQVRECAREPGAGAGGQLPDPPAPAPQVEPEEAGRPGGGGRHPGGAQGMTAADRRHQLLIRPGARAGRTVIDRRKILYFHTGVLGRRAIRLEFMNKHNP
jgi:hypothetical protein